MGDAFDQKVLLQAILFGIGILCSGVYSQVFQTQTVITFCDVGQGDSTLIQTKTGVDILIDAGPPHEILDCLGIRMSIVDTYIDIVMISHVHLDHYGGLEEILKRYKVGMVIVNKDMSDAEAYVRLMQKLSILGIAIHHSSDGEKVHIEDDISLTTVWPRESTYADTTYSNDPNALSLVTRYSEGEFDILFTGDATPNVLADLQDREIMLPNTIDILKVPHHGSENGLTRTFLHFIRPKMSVISVGLDNRYDHPDPEVISILDQYGKPYALTSQDGHVTFKAYPDGTFVRQ